MSNEKNRKETANLTNYANWLAQVNWGELLEFLRYRWLRAMDWFMLAQGVFNVNCH